MRAGILNRLVNIRSPSITSRSTDGEPILSWSTILSNIWADRRPISGRELFSQDARWSNVTRTYIIRYTTVAVTPECRLYDIEEGLEYDIKSVIDIRDERDAFELIVERTS